MKALKFIMPAILVVVMLIGVCSNFAQGTESVELSNLLRIHIRANSNEVVDQNIKYKIKDSFVEFLTPLLADCDTKQKAINLVSENNSKLKQIADEILKENNFNYTSNIKITKEQFPTRVYGEYTVPSGIYDAIIVELGNGTGDNWWCVIYPPLCFTNFSTYSQNIVYKSKIMDIINKFFNKE